MPRAYWVAHVKVHDPDRYQQYLEGAKAAFEKHNARFLVRGTPYEQNEGPDMGTRHVVIEFASMEDAKACYHSQTYQDAKAHRDAASTAFNIIAEGVE